MHRRTLLKAAGLALLGSVAEGVPAIGAPAVRRLSLPAVRVEWERVLRTVVGLRPHRPSGFVVRAERFGAQTLIHNYGHGGAGMSLSWGCASLVADLARMADGRRVAVIGCGAPGLTTARALQQRGYHVTIYAATVPPDTTSNKSLATFTPASGLVAADRRTPAWDAQFTEAAAISYRTFLQEVRRGSGVSWVDTFTATDDPTPAPPDPDEAGLLPDRISGREREVLAPGHHPFPTAYAVRTRSLRIEPAIFLEALVRDVRAAGGRIVIRRLDSQAAMAQLPEPIVVNCTGLGSRELFGDDELIPIKGQLTLLAPQREVNYRVAVRAVGPADSEAQRFAMTPRADGIVIGNFQERGNWSLEPDEDAQRRVMRSAMAFFDSMAIRRL